MTESKSSPGKWVIVLVLALVAVGSIYLYNNQRTGKNDGVKDKIVLQLKWVPQAQFAGYFTALEKGYYDDENIEVEIKSGGVGINPVDVLIADDADVAVAWTGNVLPATAKGEELVNIGQGLQRTGMVLVAKKSSGILTPADIRGKKIGVWPGGNETEPFAFIAKQGLDRDKDVEIVSQGFDMNQLLNDEIDLASAMKYNELELVFESGLNPEDLTIFDLEDSGAGMLQDGLFVRKEFLDENEDVLVRFLRASMKGWDYAVMNQEEAVDLIGMDFTENDVTARPHQIKSMEKMAELFIADKGTTEGLFYIDRDKLENTVDIAREFVKEVKEGQDFDINDIYTNKIWEKAVRGVNFSDYSNI